MDAKELMIKNYVFNKSGEISKVFALDEDGISVMSNEISYLYEDIKPIPLTEQCLIDFGFKKEKSLNKKTEIYRINLDTGHIIDYRKPYIFLGHFGLYNIKYVHQLQNLYFALTGKELTKNK